MEKKLHKIKEKKNHFLNPVPFFFIEKVPGE